MILTLFTMAGILIFCQKKNYETFLRFNPKWPGLFDQLNTQGM